ncbi:MAG: hypothetical protein COB17_05475 [Sulfurimonas sp.]|nr:MAG: hypothetical protein COB17_05475 [Sulfurimonas sp.]
MRELFFRYFFLLFLSLSFLLFSGCSDRSIGSYLGNINVFDTDTTRSNAVIKTKVVNQDFNLTLDMYVADFDTDGYFGYAIYAGDKNGVNSLIPNTTAIFDYQDPMTYKSGGASGYVVSFLNLNVNQAVLKAFVRFDICLAKFERNTPSLGEGTITTTNYDGSNCGTVIPAVTHEECSGEWVWGYSGTIPTVIDTPSYTAQIACDTGSTDIEDQIPCYVTYDSDDYFAVRPDKFTMKKADGADINLLTSALDVDLNITAEDFLGLASSGYTTSSALSILNPPTYYRSDALIDDTASMLGSVSITSNPNFTNGLSTNTPAVQFDDVGKITISIQDKTWAAIDADDTAQDCSPNGAYICGDLNATFIPASFSISNAHLRDANNTNFTYISNDHNISASLDANITAVNALGAITHNFTDNLWENNIDISFNVHTANIPNIKRDEINNANLVFTNGSAFINYKSTTNNNQLRFNFDRNKSIAINPFLVMGNDVTLNASSTYTNTIITGTGIADRNATFLYARSYASEYSFNVNNGTVFIYYENYCNTDGNISLLPNGLDSNISDDPRWYVNTKHNTLLNGGTLNISQKNDFIISNNGITETHNDISSTTLTANTNNFPYIATMLHTPKSWLIYNKYNNNAINNEFKVRFLNQSALFPISGWSGKASSVNVKSTNNFGTVNTNRRSMW